MHDRPGSSGDRTKAAAAALTTGAWLVAALFASGVRAEPVVTIVQSGDPSNRLDIAVIGDGYTVAQLGQYAIDVDQLFQEVFAEEPFDEYASYINVHRIDVSSNESGADHPERSPPVFVDTALDATYNCSGIRRVICVNLSQVNTILLSSLAADERDVVLVLVNDPESGGSGGLIAVVSVHPAVADLFLHEVGHSVGLLTDEYGGGGPSCIPDFDPLNANATKQTVRSLIKWNHWIDASTPIPTTTVTTGVPGLFEGARYCDTGVYRPTYNSLMRSIGRRYEQINSEQLVKRIYNWVSPIDAFAPHADSVDLGDGETQTFDVTVLQPLTHDLDVTWLIDDVPVAVGLQYVADADVLDAGVYTLEVVVADGTPLVRSDPSNALREIKSWTLAVPEPGRFPLELCALGCVLLLGKLRVWAALPTAHRLCQRRAKKFFFP